MPIKKPASPQDLLQWEWADFQPGYAELMKQILTPANVGEWLSGWSLLSELGDELFQRLEVATTVNTADKVAEKRLEHFMQKTFPGISEGDQKLKEKLLASSLQPVGFDSIISGGFNQRGQLRSFQLVDPSYV